MTTYIVVKRCFLCSTVYVIHRNRLKDTVGVHSTAKVMLSSRLVGTDIARTDARTDARTTNHEVPPPNGCEVKHGHFTAVLYRCTSCTWTLWRTSRGLTVEGPVLRWVWQVRYRQYCRRKRLPLKDVANRVPVLRMSGTASTWGSQNTTQNG